MAANPDFFSQSKYCDNAQHSPQLVRSRELKDVQGN